MRKIDVVELFVTERILKLTKEQGEKNYYQSIINELTDIQSVIMKVKTTDDCKTKEQLLNKNIKKIDLTKLKPVTFNSTLTDAISYSLDKLKKD